MASIRLRTLRLHDADRPEDWVEFQLMSALSETAEASGAVRRTGTGRTRVVSRRGKSRPWSITLPHCTPDQITWITDHVGRTVMARDDRGHLVYGVYFEAPANLHSYNADSDTTLTFAEVTWDGLG